MPFGNEVKRLRTRLSRDEQGVAAGAPALMFRAAAQAPNFAVPAHNLVAPAANFAAQAPTPIAQAHNFAIPAAAQAVVFTAPALANQDTRMPLTITLPSSTLWPRAQDLNRIANRATTYIAVDAPTRPSSPRSRTPSL